MSQPELSALLELLGMLFLDPRTAVLMPLLIIAAVSDYRKRRIPNPLVVTGSLFAIVYNTLVPPFATGTILFPIGGLLTGFALFLPLYLLRATGAGDVKLLAMVGAFLGPLGTLNAAIATFIVGGLLSVIFVVKRRTAPRLFQNVSMFVRLGLMGAMAGAPNVPRFDHETSAGRLPYAIAIAAGTIGYLVLHQLGMA